MDGKAQTRGKAQGSEYAQGVLTKPQVGIADAANNTALKVFPAAERIGYAVLVAVRHSVYGKIAPRKILGKTFCKADTVGVAVVGIYSVNAIGGDFYQLAIDNDRYGAVLNAGVKGFERSETILNLRRLGVGAHIPVVRSCSYQCVAHTAAHHVGFKAVGGKRTYNCLGVLGNCYLHEITFFKIELFAFISFNQIIGNIV